MPVLASSTRSHTELGIIYLNRTHCVTHIRSLKHSHQYRRKMTRVSSSTLEKHTGGEKGREREKGGGGGGEGEGGV